MLTYCVDACISFDARPEDSSCQKKLKCGIADAMEVVQMTTEPLQAKQPAIP